MPREITLYILFAVIVVAAMAWAGQSDYEDALLQERAYCHNVTLYHASAGEQGWPDYEGYYNTVCEKYRDDPELWFRG